MPIEFTCPHCQSLLRVDDANAGKRARCPHCSVINRIPGERADIAPAPPVSHQFFIDSVSGQTYGPVTKTELENWVNEGRVSSDCLIRGTGEKTGNPATVYFPDLGKLEASSNSYFETPTAAHAGEFSDVGPDMNRNANPFASGKAKPIPDGNPYAPPASTYAPKTVMNQDGVTPTRADLGEVFTIAYSVFMQNFGLLVGIGVVIGLLQLLIEIVTDVVSTMEPVGLVLGLFTILFLYLIQIYLLIGQTRISLKLVRGQRAEFAELFAGGDKFLPIVGYSILTTIALVFGFLLLIVPGILLMLYYWPSYYFAVDNKTSVMDSFEIASKVGSQNLFNSFVLGLTGFGILVLGAMLCFVGFFFANAFVSVLWATAYLLMSGQVASRYLR